LNNFVHLLTTFLIERVLNFLFFS